MKIKLEDRFSENQLRDMFTIRGKRIPRSGGRKASRGVRNAKQPHDHLAEGVSVHPPGKDRVADLVAFYEIAQITEMEVSPFNI